MDYIDHHLDEQLTLEKLASVAVFSKYHFHRIFYALVGETPGQFVQRTRLSRAAVMLVSDRARPVTDVAYSVGFSDISAFSRAFRQQFGVSARDYRRKRSNLSMVDGNLGKEAGEEAAHNGDILITDRRNTMSQLETRPIPAKSVEVVKRDAIPVAYVRHTGPYAGDSQLFERLFGQLMAWAGPRGLYQPGVTAGYVIYHDDPSTVEPEKQRISVCIPVPAGTEGSGEVGRMELDAATYAEAHFELNPMQFTGAWNWVFAEWLPDSGYQPDDHLCFERYPPMDAGEQAAGASEGVGANGPPGPGSFVMPVDICVPVKPM